MEKVDGNKIYGKRHGKHADMMKAQYSVKVPVSEKNPIYPQEGPGSVIIDGTIDCHHAQIDFDSNVEEAENDNQENIEDLETFEF